MTTVYINHDDEEFCETIENNLLNEIVFCRRTDNRTFCAKLVEIRCPLLFFEIKSGKIITNLVKAIVSIQKHEDYFSKSTLV